MENRLAERASHSASARYGVAVASAVAGLIIRFALASGLGETVPYITFFLATSMSATFGGFGPGMLTTVLGGILAGLYVVPPFGSLAFSAASDYVGFLLYMTIGAFISYQAHRLIRATQHENALRGLFEQTLMSIGDAVISTDDEMRVRLMNSVAEQLTGWTQAEANGKYIGDVFRIVTEGSDTPVEIPVEKVLKTGRIVGLANHTELVAKDGRRIPIDDSGAPIRDQRGAMAGAVLVFRDIIERRAAEVALENSERRSRQILESITDAFVLLDRDWRIIDLNATAEKLVGRSAESLIGTNHWEEFPDSVGTVIESSYRRAVAERISVHFEVYYDAWGRWFEINAYPSGDDLAVYFRDITERKHSEAALHRLNEDLQQFTFAATHDFREPLRMMTAYVQMLQRRVGHQLDEESRSYIARVVNGGERISRLIDGLLEFSGLGALDGDKPKRVSAEAALSEALGNLQVLTAETKASVTHQALPDVVADPVHLCQLFQNLVGNALKYRTPDIAPEIRISAEKDGLNWLFAVQDNGIGVDPKHFGQIFMPFKRLHGSEISGAGIGLATCKRIVERYNGRIWLESQERKGSTFYFTLPSANEGLDAGMVKTRAGFSL
jgi:PAS domain S-box-containing protein